MCCCSSEKAEPVVQGLGCACGCGCGFQSTFVRRFLSNEDRASRLDAYRAELLKEAAEVENRSAALRAAKD
jgi:hypothetical protein